MNELTLSHTEYSRLTDILIEKEEYIQQLHTENEQLRRNNKKALTNLRRAYVFGYPNLTIIRNYISAAIKALEGK